MRDRPSLPLDRKGMRPGDRVCAAISGGADSVALLLSLHALNGAAKNGLGVGLSAAHVHHHLRGEEADGDLAFVVALCTRLDVPLHIHHADIGERVSRTRETVEEAARGARYGWFRELIGSGEADCVLTAHTLDDQAETVLMKLLRGAWTEGLGGIHPVVSVGAGRILRPMLGVRRVEVEAFLGGAGQPWREDSSNAETIYTRNRLRHQVLPLLRELNPGLDGTLSSLAEIARGEEAHWERTLGQLLPQLLLPGKPVRGGGRAVGTAVGEQAIAFELERLRGLDLATRRRVIRAGARRMGARLSFDETERLLEFCAAPAGRAGLRLQLAGGVEAQRSVRELRLTRGGN